jgi:hypothetical protein
MGHVLEPAASGRSRCRGCARAIGKGELRFGERMPNPFADEGDSTLWFHPRCAAYKRPEPFLEALAEHGAALDDRERLEAEARRGIELRRLPRIDGAERASSGRAACRSCRAPIAKDTWRIRLVYFEDGRFVPGGFVHASCASGHFGTALLLERVVCFAPDLEEAAPDERAELEALLATPPNAAPEQDPA